MVLGQADVEAKTSEIPMSATLPGHIDLAGAVITADALHARRAHAGYLSGQRGAHYLITVRRNQPGLHAQLAALPWRQVPVACRTRGQRPRPRRTAHPEGHRRRGRAGLPHAARAIQIVRRRRPLTSKNSKNSKKWSTETVYAITSLTVIQARPAGVASFARGHRGIENRLHQASKTLRRFTTPRPRCGYGPRACWAWRRQLSC